MKPSASYFGLFALIYGIGASFFYAIIFLSPNLVVGVTVMSLAIFLSVMTVMCVFLRKRARLSANSETAPSFIIPTIPFLLFGTLLLIDEPVDQYLKRNDTWLYSKLHYKTTWGKTLAPVVYMQSGVDVKHFQPSIPYEYEVDGKTFQWKIIEDTPVYRKGQNSSTGSLEEVERRVKELQVLYPSGSPIQVTFVRERPYAADSSINEIKERK